MLSDRALHEAVRKGIRLRGVPLQDVEDILNAVIADAHDDPGLPLNDPEAARHRLCGTARHKSIDDARGRKRTKARVVQPGSSWASAITALRMRSEEHTSALHAALPTGFPLQDVEAILNAVTGDAPDAPGLPLNDPEAARHRLCGTARHKSIDDARGRKRTKARVVQPGSSWASAITALRM